MRDKNSIAVDASCTGNPGPMEYQWIDIQTNKRIIYSWVYPKWTNNLGEFLAIVEALQYMEKQKNKKIIYTDSQTALFRIQSRKIKTTLEATPETTKLLTDIQAAIARLKTHEIESNTIQKRDTAKRWEIPADFGRK